VRHTRLSEPENLAVAEHNIKMNHHFKFQEMERHIMVLQAIYSKVSGRCLQVKLYSDKSPVLRMKLQCCPSLHIVCLMFKEHRAL